MVHGVGQVKQQGCLARSEGQLVRRLNRGLQAGCKQLCDEGPDAVVDVKG